MYSNWKKHFRHPDFRGGQEDAANKMAEALDNEQKFIIAELPTGVGKSDIAMSLGRCAPHSYIITSQNILIEQYKKDFGHLPLTEFYSVKGKRHYICHDGYENCDMGDQKDCCYWKQHKPENRVCHYKTERDTTVNAKVALLNTTYYALATKQEPWFERHIAIIDEAHNLAGEIMNLTEMKLSNKILERLRLAHTLPEFKVEDPKFKNSVSNKQFSSWVMMLKDELDRIVKMIHDKDEATDFWSTKDIELLIDLHSRIGWYNRSISEGVKWVIDNEITKRKGRVIVARPLDTAFFANNLIFSQADQFVLQSATIVDVKKYCAELGIELGKGQVKWIKKGSPFPVENRLVYKMNTADMGYKVIDNNLPKIVDMVDEILSKRPNEKGLIHTGSYKIQKYLQEHFEWNDRVLCPDPSEREDAIKEHISSKEPTVLISPSITEGFDGKGDLCRFQIICKIPYPSLGDRRTSILANRDWGWYHYQTLKTVIQAVGRGCRSPKDWCSTYILDAGFDTFIKRAKPNQGFLECLRSKEEGYKALEE